MGAQNMHHEHNHSHVSYNDAERSVRNDVLVAPKTLLRALEAGTNFATMLPFLTVLCLRLDPLQL